MSYPPPGWGYGYGEPAQAPRPGVIPLRPLALGDLLEGAFRTIRGYPTATLGLPAALGLLLGLADFALFRSIADEMAAAEEAVTGGDVSVLTDAVAAAAGPFLLRVALSWVTTVILTGVLTVVVGRAVLGRPITVSDAWQLVRPRLLALLGLSILVGILIASPWILVAALVAVLSPGSGAEAAAAMGLLFLLTLPAIVMIYVLLAFSSASLMLETTHTGEQIGIVGAVKRSAGLVRGAWWRTFGILLLVTLLAGLLASVVTGLFEAIGRGVTGTDTLATSGIPGLTVMMLSSAVALSVTGPITAVVTVLLYVDRRIRKERLDVELARAAGIDTP